MSSEHHFGRIEDPTAGQFPLFVAEGRLRESLWHRAISISDSKPYVKY